MTETVKNTALFLGIAVLVAITGFMQSWNSAILIVNMGLISAIMAIGVNLQWGFAGLFNVGIMGFVALGGLAVVLVSEPLSPEAWSAGGFGIVLALLLGAATVVAAVLVARHMPKGRSRNLAMLAVLVLGFIIYRAVFDLSLIHI